MAAFNLQLAQLDERLLQFENFNNNLLCAPILSFIAYERFLSSICWKPKISYRAFAGNSTFHSAAIGYLAGLDGLG